METNDVIRTILARRSIRSFRKDLPVEPAKRDALLACACAAPSAHNRQPCRFLVLEDRVLLDRLAAELRQGFLYEQVPLAIAVCADLREYPEGSYGWLEDCAAAMENMLIAAKSLGLEALWFGVYRRAPKEQTVRQILELPDYVEVQGIAVVGYGSESKEPRNEADPSKISYGCWKEKGYA
ncbi:MAG TPA: nitroreductase family protein [Synergistaceae bacterium]|nr:nitroreductase family protein [Synergistaceae bacterium]HPJ26681.1 nitroreductase family protein [Synergistaceae bacterium]HPQ37917.1 nitroreductase family protein [Synergistaceae bacterium]